MLTKDDTTYRIRGQVIDTKTKRGIQGLRVEAWDKDLICSDLVGSAVTDAQGGFQMEFKPSYFQELFLDRRPDLFFRVFRGNRLLCSTEQSVIWNVQAGEIPVVIPVDWAAGGETGPGEPDAPRRLRVSGCVRFEDGWPAAGARVAAFDRNLRREQQLGATRTDQEGVYRINYSLKQLLHQERGSAHLVVKAFEADGSILAVSPVLFKAPPDARIDLTIPLAKKLPPSLFERIGAALAPRLGQVAIEELEEDQKHQDLTFLSGQTGYEKRLLARFVLAHRLAGPGLEGEFWFALLGGSFFDYNENESLEENLAMVKAALPGLDGRTVQQILGSSFNRREIGAGWRDHVAAWGEAFLAFTARLALGEEASPSFAKLALEHAGIKDVDKQARFARRFNEDMALTPAVLQALKEDPAFTASEIADLRTSYQLAELTGGDFSVVKMLKEEFNVRQPEQIRLLAKKSEREWVELLECKHQAGEIQLPLHLPELAGEVKLPAVELYAQTLANRFQEAFPTAAFWGGLERALHHGGVRGMRHGESLCQLIEGHPDFELLGTPIDGFLDQDLGPEFANLAKDETFRLELKAVQRVFKLAPTFEATEALLADGLHSAQMIYRLGESEFVRRYCRHPGFSEKKARLAWNRAANTHAAALMVIGDLAAFEDGVLPGVFHDRHPDLDKFPNWQNLFRQGDICHCEACRSVLSPAAYFADLLMFLRDRGVKDILLRRRPDLGYLELSCANAQTTLPYVDVVCEVLEKVVAAEDNDAELRGLEAIPGDEAAAQAAVAAALRARGISAGSEFSLSQVDPADPDRWVVHGDEATYLLKKKGTPNFFAELLPNTKASGEELRAYPAYVNPKAYNKLKTAPYPLAVPLELFSATDPRRAEQRARGFSLPFDLFSEEVRAAFQKCNLARWDLMRTFCGTAPPNNPTEGEIAAEYFGISSDASAEIDEKRLILSADATAAGQQAVWGETGNAGWLTTLANVETFLRKTGLEYEELLALLDLPFINPTGDIYIEHLDASCDTDKQVIVGFTPAGLDRIHRFLRLWHKLSGWQMWELDLAIRSAGIGGGTLDEPFLVNLYYLARLRSRLGPKTTVEQLCALFDNLNTETHFTKPHDKRAEGLYQNLFLNKKLLQPLDPAFEVAAVAVAGPTEEKTSGHQPVILSALGICQRDLTILAGLTRASNRAAYITDDLTLANLSFLWRHAWLAKLLKFKAEEWQTILHLLQQDVPLFTNPRVALEFVENVDHLKATGFTPDELNWLLAADGSARAAMSEAEAARFLTGLRAELQAIRKEYDAAQYSFLEPPADLDRITGLLTSLLQRLNRTEAEVRFCLDTLCDQVQQQCSVTGLPAGFDFPEDIKNLIRIRYDEPTTTLFFTGFMTEAQRTTLLEDPALAAVTRIAAYQQAVEKFFQTPRLALKFLAPVFTAPLDQLPGEVDFRALPDPALAQKISYDPEERALRLVGVLTEDAKNALDALSANPDYRDAVHSLFTQPTSGVFPPDELWLQDADLLFPLRDLDNPANDHLNANMATAVKKALAYLAKTLSEGLVVRQAGAALGLTEGLTRRLLTEYAILPEPLLSHLTGPFAATIGAVDYYSDSPFKPTFDGWFWASRVAALWRKWQLTLEEWKKLRKIAVNAQLLDFAAVPLDVTGAGAPIEQVLRTSRLMRFKASLPEAGTTLLEVLEKLNAGQYARKADFAAEVELLNEAWGAADVEALVKALDLEYPADYLLAENWERLRRAFYFVDSLNAAPDKVKTFAAPAMTDVHAKDLKELLRAKFGNASWLTLSAEIQDALRERKRDALAAYLLTRPKPADAPTGKWENTNDLYGYYLLDVEMGACQLTSRLVQASGSVQLFVQRCFMGLEPEVTVIADGPEGDSAWRWWQWMRKYRVWEANRKVFLWPENWIEPELKKDRSPFFKDLENELRQNEVNQYTVEKALANYLEKLDGVAQLEIAGFYQEDDGDNSIIHVFGRTTGAEPHLYYYRRYDYRQWTPWEKVDLDIQGDYLIPAVINRRLFLFWPVFTEVPDENKNKMNQQTPTAGDVVNLQPAWKRLRLQMAVSDYRQGKWTPKRVSKQYAENRTPYNVEIVHKHYSFLPVDYSAGDGRFGVIFSGFSIDADGVPLAGLIGAFEITGCQGVPEPADLPGSFLPVIRPASDSTGASPSFLRWEEQSDREEEDLTLESRFPSFVEGLQRIGVLQQTPWLFRIYPPWQLSYLDRLMADAPSSVGVTGSTRTLIPYGTWLPFFYQDKKRTFFVLPSLWAGQRDGKLEIRGSVRSYYPDIKRWFSIWEEDLEKNWRDKVDQQVLPPCGSAERKKLERDLYNPVPTEIVPPFTDEQVRDLMVRYYMQFVHYYQGLLSLRLFQFRQFHFLNFYHPFVCDFAKLIHNPLQGIPGLMKRETQLLDRGFSFEQSYRPTAWVVDPSTDAYYPREIVDFSPDGAYAPYNWELFFHVPLFIANTLSKNQRFEEAREWYHYIFNPIGVESSIPGGSGMSKYWITKPFFETTNPQYLRQRIENLLGMLARERSEPGQPMTELEKQVWDWRTNPFEPHRIANYRTVAYQKTVVMKYLDNLIAWGDYLFRQDSMESINEATQLYILAAEILGPRSKRIPPPTKPPLESFNELETQLDAFANALVAVENLIPPLPGTEESGPVSAPLPSLYFCIPHNEKMLSYWDTVADRLYKIRHCMNIEGVERQLALFEPPIEPGALVKAVAAGVDLSAALADLNAPLPLYRFNVLLQKANEVCNDVKALGVALLSTLEKKDAEALSLLRQGQEIIVLEAVKAIREQQIHEARENLEGLKKSRELAEIRKNYYDSREFMNPGEEAALALSGSSLIVHTIGTVLDILGGALALVPDFDVGVCGVGGSPVAKVKTGGTNTSKALELSARSLYQTSAILDKSAAIANLVASHQRRKDDWDFQADLAAKEIEQVEKSIAAAKVRIAIAEKELENHLTQMDNAKAVDTFMRSKYTNEELYQWHVGQISGVYFQSYKLAYDLAKRAERCLQFELGLQDSSFISFGHWDSLKKGLLAGEKLQYDLRRLEAAYLEQNRREFELTKHISLLHLDPIALVKLRETGRCFISLPEEIFDLDYPGHYFRRIKSVSLSLPCVAGPYTTVSCTLRLLKNSVRITTGSGDNGYPRNTDDAGHPADDMRFVENNIPVKAIAASSGQNDAGVFELNFRDERYLPFEGAGVISEWSLELFHDLPANNPDPANPDFGRPLRQFDYRTITDAILHIKYTAREDAGGFKNAVITHLRNHFSADGATPAWLALNLRRDFPTAWSHFLKPIDPTDGNVFELKMSAALFPMRDADKTLKINALYLLARCTDPGTYGVTLTPPLPEPPPPEANTMSLVKSNTYGGLHFGLKDVSAASVQIGPTDPPVTWKIRVTRPGGGNLIEDPVKRVMEVEEIIMVLGYEWE